MARPSSAQARIHVMTASFASESGLRREGLRAAYCRPSPPPLSSGGKSCRARSSTPPERRWLCRRTRNSTAGRSWRGRPCNHWPVPRVFAQEVLPVDAHVALVDRTWQDYPYPDDDDAWVTFRAESLDDPDQPPYPGVTVKAGGWRDPAGQSKGVVLVEIWLHDTPPLLTCVFTTELHVGQHAVLVGNERSTLHYESIDEGTYALSVFVDTPDDQRTVRHVAFLLDAADDHARVSDPADGAAD